jgi:hypothetical protein
VWRAIALFLFTTTVGCAGFTPTLIGTETDLRPDLAITALTADESGVLLGLRSASATEGDLVEVWRRPHNGDWERASAFPVTAELVEPLQAGLVDWRDAPADRDLPIAFQLRLRRQSAPGDASLTHSAPVVVTVAAPGSPPIVQAEVQMPAVVLLTCEPAEGARVLRRDLLSEDAFHPFAILDAASHGALLDHRVQPGGVYAYRLQTVTTDGTLQVFSPFSEPLYVAVPTEEEEEEGDFEK